MLAENPGSYARKYDREKDKALHEMSHGNKSKYEGNISNMYTKIKKAIDEEEAHEESLKNKVKFSVGADSKINI